jgi:hypothetical protein
VVISIPGACFQPHRPWCGVRREKHSLDVFLIPPHPWSDDPASPFFASLSCFARRTRARHPGAPARRGEGSPDLRLDPARPWLGVRRAKGPPDLLLFPPHPTELRARMRERPVSIPAARPPLQCPRQPPACSIRRAISAFCRAPSSP